jgi:MoaA/NifB/PqqE/SkfB family radical SAM enzyme
MTKKITCLAPWVHSHIQATNQRSLCCLHAEGHEVDTHEEFWNGEYMKNVRKKFLNGEQISGCDHCYGNVNREEHSRYYVTFQRTYGHLQDEILEKTNEDGSTTFVPQSFDYRTSLCNLSCKTCATNSSSSIAANSNRVAGKKIFPIVNYKQSFNRQWDDVQKVLTKDSKFMYWAGGEPTMNPIYWKTMDYLAEQGWTHIQILYHLNLMTLTDEKLYNRIINNFNTFPDTRVNLSLDGMGEVGEYIRTGLDWNTFDNLYTKLVQDCPNTTFVVDVTMTNLTLMQLPELLKYSLSKNKHIEFKAMFESPGQKNDGIFHNYNRFLSINLLTPETFNKLIKETEEILNNNQETLKTNLKEFLPFLIESYKPRELNEDDITAIKQMEERHKDKLSLLTILKDQNLSSVPS